jgi:hypothetical protein
VLLGVLFEIELLTAVAALKLFSSLFQFSFILSELKYVKTVLDLFRHLEYPANLVPHTKTRGFGSDREMLRS